MAVPSIFVKRYFTSYGPDPKNPGQMLGVDWVEYGPMAGLDRTTTIVRVKNLLEKMQPLADSQNPAVIMAHERADVIRKGYNAWKSGQELPTSGTPLAAWNGVTPEQAEVMIRAGIRSVEEVAALTDATSSRLGLSNRNSLIQLAKNFLDSKEQSVLAGRLTEKDEKINLLALENEDAKAQMADMQEKLRVLTAQIAMSDPKEAPKKRNQK